MAKALTRKVEWKRGEGQGEWVAFLNGHEVASCHVNYHVPTGYYRRYEGSCHKNIAPGEGVPQRRYAPETLTLFKEHVQRRADRLPADSPLLTTRGTDDRPEGAMEIPRDTMLDIARVRREGATWAQAARPYGVPWQTLRAAFYRKSNEVYGL